LSPFVTGRIAVRDSFCCLVFQERRRAGSPRERRIIGVGLTLSGEIVAFTFYS